MMLKKKHIVALVSAATLMMGTAYAADAGAYVGGTIGYGDVHETGVDKDTGLSGRLFGGYKFNQYAAAELGYSHFRDATIDLGSLGNFAIKTNAVDLVGKGILPLQQGFNVYGKLGVAYLMAKGEVTVSSSTASSDTYHRWYPTFGLGAGYDINKNLTADVSWNRIQKVGNTNSSDPQIPSTDMFGVGLTYNFG